MLLKTENLSKAYESRKKGEPVFWAAREVCLEIPEGKTIGLLGPSGSGKSTVGQMIVGLAKPTSGKIFFKGECLDKPLTGELRKKIQILFQHPEDLIFFQGTYDTPGASHVGIYVGNNMMIHCGNPIQYTSIASSYWQQHFMAFGRLH